MSPGNYWSPPDNPERLHTEAAFAGVAPLPASSEERKQRGSTKHPVQRHPRTREEASCRDGRTSFV